MTGILNNEGKMNLNASIKLPRQSNIELLRIISMLMILVVHTDFWALGGPKLADFYANPANAITRTVIQSITIVAVNVFIMISGWFGIKPRLRGLCNFLFQCAFFYIGIYLALLTIGLEPLSMKNISACLCITPVNWFIMCYFALYLLSPLMNAFLEKASKRQLEIFLAIFYIFQTIWGWPFGGADFVKSGYSPFSFIGLYILARYLHLYGNKLLQGGGVWIYITTIPLNSVIFFMSLRYNVIPNVYAYCNPLVIIGAAGLLVWFSRLKMGYHKVINYIAGSCFAVFLLHSQPNLGVPYYKGTVLKIYENYSGAECIALMGVFVVSVFVLAVLIDQARIFNWKHFEKRIPDIKY